MPKKILLYVVLISFCLFLVINLSSPIKIQGDGVFYYNWLHSALFDGDLDFTNELQYYSAYDLGSKWFLENNVLTQSGKVPNPYAFGMALMLLPLILIANLFTWIFNSFNPELFILDGYSYFYNLAVNFSTWIFGTLSLIIIYKINRIISNQDFKSSLKAVLAIFLATPWIYYQFLEPSMSHIISLFLVSWWWYLVILKWQRKDVNFLLFILVTFLMLATRWQNLIFCLAFIPLIFQKVDYKKTIQIIKRIILIITPIVLFWLSQFLIWKHLYGQYILVPQGYMFVKFDLHPFYVLFSSNRGLFLWSPILILAIIGWYFLLKKSKFLAWTTFVLFIGQWLINSSLNDLGGGDAFGARRFIETFPFLAMCLTALYQKLKKCKWQSWIVVIVLIFWNFILIENYRLEYLPHSGEFNITKINYLQVINRDFNKFILRN